MLRLKLFAAAFLVALLAACSYAPSNVVVLNTTDCGKSWSQIPTGTRVPNNTANVCGYNIQLPDYPMQGNTTFLTQFQGNVLVKVEISYDYQITDYLKYIQYAKFLGKKQATSSEQDDTNANAQGSSRFETAENVVIDVRLRELVTTDTSSHDVVQFNPTEFEDALFKKANEALASRGVTLNSMTFVILPEDQTRMAIDAATAMAVYKSKGMEQLGNQLVIARASATRVIVNGDEKN